jgi:hypothetical protein
MMMTGHLSLPSPPSKALHGTGQALDLSAVIEREKGSERNKGMITCKLHSLIPHPTKTSTPKASLGPNPRALNKTSQPITSSPISKEALEIKMATNTRER